MADKGGTEAILDPPFSILGSAFSRALKQFRVLFPGRWCNSRGVEIFLDVTQLFHSDQRRCHSRRRADELKRTLTVGFYTFKSLADDGREIARQLSLQHGCAANDSNVERLGCFEYGQFLVSHSLIGIGQCFAHAEIERQLNDFEMVILAAGLFRYGKHMSQ